jgi:hypothetical protein
MILSSSRYIESGNGMAKLVKSGCLLVVSLLAGCSQSIDHNVIQSALAERHSVQVADIEILSLRPHDGWDDGVEVGVSYTSCHSKEERRCEPRQTVVSLQRNPDAKWEVIAIDP